MSDSHRSEWSHTTLGAVVRLQRGHDLPTSARIPGDVPVVGSGDADGWHNQAIACGPGVVIGRATNLGRPKYVRGPYWPLNTTLYVKDFLGNDERYTYYLFTTLNLTGFDSGSVQPMLNRNNVENVPVLLPPIAEQHAIAEVLGALDDKIEANRRMDVALDELASTLFQKMYSPARSEGSTPLLDRVEILTGGTPRTSESGFWNGPIPWVSVVDLMPGPWVSVTEKGITCEGVENSAAKLLPDRTVVISARGTVGRVALTCGPMAINQSCYGLRDIRDYQLYLLHLVRMLVPRLRAGAHGSVFDTITRRSFESVTVRALPEESVAAFESGVTPMYDLILANARASQTLGALRDALIPKLFSGELRVRDAEELVGTAV